jgi:hypothetical protein
VSKDGVVVNAFDAIDAGIAPRIEAGWNAMAVVLADERWHSRAELTLVCKQTGLSQKAAENLLGDAVRTNRVIAKRSAGDREYRLPLPK